MIPWCSTNESILYIIIIIVVVVVVIIIYLGKTVTLSRAVYKSPPILNLTNCSYPGCNCTMDTECDTKLCIPELKVGCHGYYSLILSPIY